MNVRLLTTLLGAMALASPQPTAIADEAADPAQAGGGEREYRQFVQNRSGGGAGGGGQGGGGFGGGGQGGGRQSYARAGVDWFAPSHLYGTPLVVVTKPMASQTAKEWTEDLTVMDKLLRDAVTRVNGDASPPQAMGIRVTMMGAKVEPMYVEDCGALFGFSVNTTLAAAVDDPDEPIESPGDAESAWARAKRGLQTDGAAPDGSALPGFPGGAPLLRPRKFEQSRVDELVDAVLKVLPEAKNIRHLPDGEVVFVTIAGVDDVGTAVRLSLKAKKSDIDKAANGSLSPEEFKARVAFRVG